MQLITKSETEYEYYLTTSKSTAYLWNIAIKSGRGSGTEEYATKIR